MNGHQKPSTGLLGGAFILALSAALAAFYSSVLPLGGLPISEPFGWLPESMQLKSVTRIHYDLPAILLLGFLLMVSWEFAQDRYAKLYSLILAGGTTWACWQVAQGARWFFITDTHPVLGWDCSRMEMVLMLAAFLLAFPWFAYLFNPRNKLILSPIGWALRTAFFRWLAGLVVFTLILIITFQHPFYLNNYYENWRIACNHLFRIYLFFGLPYAFATNLLRGHRFEDRGDSGFILLLLLRRGIHSLLRNNTKHLWHLGHKRIGIVLRDLGVKLFFIPLMVSFLYIESSGFTASLTALKGNLTDQATWYPTYSSLYGMCLHGLFIVDVSLALIGYVSSSRWLDNKSKSVDPSFFGWFIALACYPPFNSITSGYFPYDSINAGHAYAIFQPEWVDALLKTVTLTCFIVYVWATAAFGLRFSNLTNRGVITRGPYAVVRHPAYIMKNIAWWCESIRNFSSLWSFVFLAAMNYIYYLRAITEERHLSNDPDYRAYCRHVKYRFIPRLW